MDSNYQNQYGRPDTWNCPRCHTANTDRFCYRCGSPRPVTAAGKMCRCGHTNVPDAKFCVKCGSSLVGQTGTGNQGQGSGTGNGGKKKPLWIIVAIIVVAVIIIGISGHEHEWEAATCKSPKKCATCGKTEGSKADHDWMPATCYAPKTCSVCGETTGFAPGHSWKVATYAEPKTCTRCGMTEGEPLSLPGVTAPQKSGDSGNYIAELVGDWEKVRLESGTSILNVTARAYGTKIKNCEKLTVHLSVEMNAGTKCTDWQLWGRVNGTFEKLARIDLPGGDGDTKQVIRFDKPVTFDALVVTPTIPGGYSWSLGFYVSDVYLAD